MTNGDYTLKMVEQLCKIALSLGSDTIHQLAHWTSCVCSSFNFVGVCSTLVLFRAMRMSPFPRETVTKRAAAARTA